jgi:hypothetical protein
MMKVSVIPFLIQERTLTDGTRIRMVSSYGTDTVMVWPTGGSDGYDKLAHGFAVTASWIDPQILGRAPKNRMWHRVPQATTEISGYNQAILWSTEKNETVLHVLPIVKAGSIVWDMLPHKSGAPGWMPFALKYKPPKASGRLDFHPAHYSDGHVIVNESGRTLLTGSDPAQVGENEEAFHQLPAFTDGKADFLGLQAYREAKVGNSYRFAFVADKIKRTDKETYTIESTTHQQIWLPLAMPMQSSSSSASDLGENPATSLQCKYIQGNYGGRGWGTFVMIGTAWVPTSSGSISFMENVVEQPISPPVAKSANAARLQIDEERAPQKRVEGVVAVASADFLEYISWEHEVSYPSSHKWRGGTETAAYTYDPLDSFYTSSAGYGTTSVTARRGDCEWVIATPVRSCFDLNWHKLNFFEGDVAGATKGNKYVDSSFGKFKRTTGTVDVITDTDAATPNSVPIQETNPVTQPWESPPPQGTVSVLDDKYSATAYAGDLRPKWISIAAGYAENGGHKEVETGYAAQTNTVEYSLTSRHVIDYDHRGRFYVALRVEVTCRGALWQHTPPDLIGTVRKISDGTYTAKIYIESMWNGKLRSELLAEDTCERPVFEATEIRISNPYYYPAADSSLDMLIRMPPLITPPAEAMRQLYTLAGHQGVNTNLACQDIEPHPPANDPKHISETGIEFSYTKNGREIAPKKYVPGCLYARTFKISDFSDALWLLGATQCDAPLDNKRNVEPPLPLWHYMPLLGAVIKDDVFHIEIRDGEIKEWSNLLVGKKTNEQGGKAQRPTDPSERKIKLYRV